VRLPRTNDVDLRRAPATSSGREERRQTPTSANKPQTPGPLTSARSSPSNDGLTECQGISTQFGRWILIRALSMVRGDLPLMTTIALFHSVLGVRPGVLAAAEVFRAAGHQVRVIDTYDGRVFDDYDEASAFAQSIGYPTLMDGALAAVADQTGWFVTAGFSMGAILAEYVAAARGGRGGGVVGSLQIFMGLAERPRVDETV